jgi:hypothetical protein
MKEQPKPPLPVCSSCKKTTAASCGRVDCPNRRPLTADLDASGYRRLSDGGYIATRRKAD